MDASIAKSTNDELKTLQLKMEILEEELRKAIARAERAEEELEKCKHFDFIEKKVDIQQYIPPPPPPPIPDSLLYSPNSSSWRPTKSQADPASIIMDNSDVTTMRTFNESIISHNLRRGSMTNIGKQQVETATGRLI